MASERPEIDPGMVGDTGLRRSALTRQMTRGVGLETLERRLESVSSQSGLVFAGKVFFVCFGTLSSVLLARILGPALLGRYQLGLTAVQIATIFSVAGFDKSMVRFLPILQIDKAREVRGFVVRNLAISLSLSILLATALYQAAPMLAIHYFHSAEMTDVLRLFAMYVPVFSLFRVTNGAAVGMKRADISSNVTNVLSPVTFVGFLLLVGLLGGRLMGCILARSITHLLGVIVLIAIVFNRFPKGVRDLKPSISLRRLLSFSTPLMLIGTIYFLLGRMDIIMLGYFVPEAEVGVYSVAVKIALFIVFGLEIVLPVVGPHFSELSERKDFESVEALFRTVTKWLFYSGLFVFAAVVLLRTQVLHLFGEEFVAGAAVLLVLGIGNLANVISGPTGQLLVMTGRQKWEVSNTSAMVGLNFFLNLLLIPRLGIIGAAIATAVSISAINLIKLVEVFFLYRIHPYAPRFIKGALAILAGSIAGYLVRIAAAAAGLGFAPVIVLAGLAMTVVTVASLWGLGFDEEDWMLLQAIRRR